MSKKQPVFPSYFADAESDYNCADFILVGVPYDKTSSFRYGSAKGPSAIRHASWNFETYNLLTDTDFSKIAVHDYGDIDNISNVTPKQMIKIISQFSEKVLTDNKIPITMGGEHSITSGIIQSFDSNTTVVILDAHLDYRETYEDEPYNHACAIKRITDTIPVENVYVIGVRSTEREEYVHATHNQLSIVPSTEIYKKGIQSIMNNIKKKINSQPLYLSIDIDVIDPGFAPGTGTPEPFGLYPFDICHIFDILCENMIGFDITEVNPLFDHGQTALLAAKYIRYGIERMSQKKD